MLHRPWYKITFLALFVSMAAFASDAQTTWNQGMEFFLARKYTPAIESLKKYLHQYPGEINALDARLYLGQAYLFSKKPKEAVTYLQSFIEGGGNLPQVNEARHDLGNAYLDLNQFTQAYLVSEELLRQPDITHHTRARALLLRAQAQTGLKQNFEAEKSLITFQTVADRDPELEAQLAESYLVSLNLKAAQCAKLPSSRALPEDQLLDQVSRKGLCVLEMAASLVKGSSKLDPPHLAEAAQTLEGAWKNLQLSCQKPSLLRGKMNNKQWSQAIQEMTLKLKESCDSTTLLLQQTLTAKEILKPISSRFTRK
jgi:TolA-binding protein